MQVKDRLGAGASVRIAACRNAYFENLTLAVIAFNALWIAVDTDHNKSTTLVDAEWPFQVMRGVSCVLDLF